MTKIRNLQVFVTLNVCHNALWQYELTGNCEEVHKSTFNLIA